MFTLSGKWSTKQILITDSFGTIELKPNYSQQIINHSPDGFNWGYGGSGPAQLALAILLHLTSNIKWAAQHHQEFKFQFIATLPQSDFVINGQAMVEWIVARDQSYVERNKT